MEAISSRRSENTMHSRITGYKPWIIYKQIISIWTPLTSLLSYPYYSPIDSLSTTTKQIQRNTSHRTCEKDFLNFFKTPTDLNRCNPRRKWLVDPLTSSIQAVTNWPITKRVSDYRNQDESKEQEKIKTISRLKG